MKPLVVFTGQPVGSVTREFSLLDDRNAYVCQIKAYCEADVMQVWVKQCLSLYCTTDEPALHMMNNFSPHTVRPVRKSIADLGCIQVNLPPNMTSQVQMLDVGINKPFKDKVTEMYNEYMIANHTHNPKITRALMGYWIAEAWHNIKVSTITNTARGIGFIDLLIN